MTTVTHFIYCLLMDGEVGHARALRERFSEKLQMHMKYHDGAKAPPLLPNVNMRYVAFEFAEKSFERFKKF